MENLTETIGNLCNTLEDALDEMDWDVVKRVAEELSELYDELEKTDYMYD